VEDLKLSHVDASVNNKSHECFHKKYGDVVEVKSTHGKKHPYLVNLDICQPTHYMTMSTCIDDDSERDYNDHDDASLPDLQPSVYEIYEITHYCHDRPVQYQESDQLPVAFQPQLIHPHFFHLDQLPSMTGELIPAASDTLSTLSCRSQPSHSLITIHFANGIFAGFFHSRLSFSTGRSLLIEKSNEFLRSQIIFKPKRQDQQKSAAVSGSRPTIEKSGKTPQRRDQQKSAAVSGSHPPIEKSGKTPQSQNVLNVVHVVHLFYFFVKHERLEY
jgi:hypothetical protein